MDEDEDIRIEWEPLPLDANLSSSAYDTHRSTRPKTGAEHPDPDREYLFTNDSSTVKSRKKKKKDTATTDMSFDPTSMGFASKSQKNVTPVINPGGNLGVGVAITPGADKGINALRAEPLNEDAKKNFAKWIQEDWVKKVERKEMDDRKKQSDKKKKEQDIQESIGNRFGGTEEQEAAIAADTEKHGRPIGRAGDSTHIEVFYPDGTFGVYYYKGGQGGEFATQVDDYSKSPRYEDFLKQYTDPRSYQSDLYNLEQDYLHGDEAARRKAVESITNMMGTDYWDYNDRDGFTNKYGATKSGGRHYTNMEKQDLYESRRDDLAGASAATDKANRERLGYAAGINPLRDDFYEQQRLRGIREQGRTTTSDERLKDIKSGYQKEELLGHLFQALTDTASCAANELQEMHWNIRGLQFDTMHLVLDKLYNEMNDDCDKLAEITAQYVDIVKGRMTAASRVEIPEVSDATDLQSVVVAINTLLDYCLEVYGHAFNAVSKITQCPISIGAANFLQTRMEFWSKERHYFNKHRGLNV